MTCCTYLCTTILWGIQIWNHKSVCNTPAQAKLIFVHPIIFFYFDFWSWWPNILRKWHYEQNKKSIRQMGQSSECVWHVQAHIHIHMCMTKLQAVSRYCATHAYSSARVSTIMHLILLTYPTTLISLNSAFYLISCLLHCCSPMHPKPSLAQLSPTLPFPIISYPTLPYTTQTQSSPWVAHSTLPQRNLSFVKSFLLL